MGTWKGQGTTLRRQRMSREGAWELVKWIPTLSIPPLWVKLLYTCRHGYMNLTENSRAEFPEVLVIGYVLIRTCSLCSLFCFSLFLISGFGLIRPIAAFWHACSTHAGLS